MMMLMLMLMLLGMRPKSKSLAAVPLRAKKRAAKQIAPKHFET
jgi:hypothetical protein